MKRIKIFITIDRWVYGQIPLGFFFLGGLFLSSVFGMAVGQ